MTQPEEFYRSGINVFASKVRKLQQKSLWVSAGRLLSFLLIMAAIYWIVNGRMSGSTSLNGRYFLLAITVLMFLFLLRLSLSLGAQKKLAEKLLFIHTNEHEVLRNNRNHFSNGETLPVRSIYSEDLDITGERSLFHFLNRTTTSHGAERLAEVLNDPFTEPPLIADHQAAVKQLSGQTELRHMILARGLLREEQEGSIEEIYAWIKSEARLYNKKWMTVIRYLLPLVNVCGLLYYLDTNNPIPMGSGVVVAWLLLGRFSRYVQRQHVMIGRKQSILDQYASILNAFDKVETGSSALLSKLTAVSETGNREIKKLSVLSALFDQRLNLLVNFFLNSFLLYEIHCIIALEKWKVMNHERFNSWIETVGDIEMLNSMAAFAFNHPGYCYPEIQEHGQLIRATMLAHPLIPAEEAVPNDFEIGKTGKLLLITGSNMSGKSTFLRTAGINLVLAQCGAPVCATSFIFTPMRILSSIRISDSLQEHTSFFMAELKRLKTIISALETGKPALVLIDEVLRGTNSSDKTHGSEALIKKLIACNCLTLFATHDLTLSELEKMYPGTVGNYCFESTISGDELFFDYKLNAGVARNKNATFLMEKMGIIER